MTIADYCQAFERREVSINRAYQRSPQVWPTQARSFLIETILKGYPIPKLALHQITDLQSRKTVKHVVDGQQRSMAILDFYNDRLVLGRSLEMREAAGRRYSNLADDLQEAFLAYSLQFDQFEAASDADVREYFRRINSFTAPLNAEEQRHARYQGAMKWFINSLSAEYSSVLVDLGVVTQKGVIRMADAKFLSEIVSAMLNGVTTTSKTTLDQLYSRFERDDEVPNEDEVRNAIDEGMDLVVSFPEIRATALMRTNVFYSLLLAAITVKSNWSALRYLSSKPGQLSVTESANQNLLELASALEEPEIYGDRFKAFTDAAAEQTNVKRQRETRTEWLIAALSQESLA